MTDAGVTVRAALADARARGLARLDAQVLLGHVLGRPRSWLLAHDDAVLDAAQATAWQALAERRATGEPLAYLVRVREFHGLVLQVDARVLIPRPETEELVDWTLELLAMQAPDGALAGGRPPAHVVDLGTGSGAIAIAIAAAARERGWHLAVHASDASRDALAVAEINAASQGVAVDVREGSWWNPWHGCRFDVAVSNPPYIAAHDPHLPALRHEPDAALASGEDGLDALRDLVAGAPDHLTGGGWLIVEHGWDQAPAVQALLLAAGFLDIQTRRDLAGQPRCTGARTARSGSSQRGTAGA